MNYTEFLNNLDEKLKKYFKLHKEHIYCKSGCSHCCESGDYPISALELEYLMLGFSKLQNDKKIIVQTNVKNMVKGGVCPFLIDKQCSIYPYRPIICRVHGIAYICHDEVVKVPYCVKEGKNYANVYKDGEIEINPIKENLDTAALLKDFNYGEIRNLINWINNKKTS